MKIYTTYWKSGNLKGGEIWWFMNNGTNIRSVGFDVAQILHMLELTHSL